MGEDMLQHPGPDRRAGLGPPSGGAGEACGSGGTALSALHPGEGIPRPEAPAAPTGRPVGEPYEATASTEMSSRFIISCRVVGLTRSSSAARFWTPSDFCNALMIS